ncbi:MAG: carboxypeptidase regulatory-like domain-containing protein [Gemmatirosa sp.]
MPLRPAASVVAIISIAALAGSVQAQTSPAPTARLEGIVHDSVSARALSGALVWLAGTDRSVVTDSAGRWAMREVPAGRVTVSFAHPALDSLGLTELRADAVLAAGETRALTLAGPSFATFARRLCTAGLPDGAGIVFGSVSDARGVLFDGARVDAEWARLVDPRAADFGTSERRRATSDARGMYALCGVVVDQGLGIAAVTDRGRSGQLDVMVPTTRLLRLDLMVGAPTGTIGPATLQGVVRDSGGRPVPNARVSYGGADAEDDSTAAARTDAAGRFTLAGLPEGTQMVDVMAIGFSPERRPVDLSAAQPAELTVTLRRATLLATVNVTAAARARFHQGLETRRLRGFGTIFDAQTLDALPDAGAALRMVPRVSVGSNRGRTSVAFRQGLASCQPDVYVDGMRVEQGSGNGGSLGRVSAGAGGLVGNLDQVPLPRQLAALEIYTRPSAIPHELHASYTECGAIFAWSKQHAARGGH